ncbi:MAG: hypothetical protein ISR68_00515 [Campylobacterales bacterium]|nr:hypothetical protein [Campylobacterales bacterium]
MNSNIKTLHSLIGSIIFIAIVYYIFLPVNKIVQIILDEYIIIILNIVSLPVLWYFKKKLQNFEIVAYIQNIDEVPLQSTLVFLLIFQVVDFYYEGGFIGMISLWFMYFVFATLIWQITHIINYYKNYKYYEKYI